MSATERLRQRITEVVEQKIAVLRSWGIVIEGSGLSWKYGNEIIFQMQFWRQGGGGTLQTRWFTYDFQWGMLVAKKRSCAKIKKVIEEISKVLYNLTRDIIIEEFHRQHGIGRFYKTGRLLLLDELVLSFELSPEDFSWKFVLKGKEFWKVIAEGKQSQSPLEAFRQVAAACALETL